MSEVALSKISSKGQIVIPANLRKDFQKGENLLIIKKKNSLILHRLKDFNKKFKEDIEFALETEKAIRRYEQGKFKTRTKEEFLKELEKC